jgi:iron complex outermembrane receptor protein
MSIEVTDYEKIQEGQLKANLSETSSRVPGVVVNNRNNPGQDLAIQIRGFGARSAFGVRGVRLYADGIPLTMPDGQGQTGTFNLDTASRVEYLKGPFSSLYGNSSGGVVQLFTKDGSKEANVNADATFGSYGLSRESLTYSGSSDKSNYIANFSTYSMDGYRDQSKTRRDTFNAKVNFNISDATKLSLVTTMLDQPDNLDPGGLTAAQVASNRTQANPNAITFNTRVTKRHEQAGLVLDHKVNENNSLRFMSYYGQRANQQFQSTSVNGQLDDRSGGGVVEIKRDFGGLDLNWTHNSLMDNMPFKFTTGLDFNKDNDRRKGFENFTATGVYGTALNGQNTYAPGCGSNTNLSGDLATYAITCGVKGRLRRDEDNTVFNIDKYFQAALDINSKWALNFGIRQSKVSFKNNDYYVNSGNINLYTEKSSSGLAALVDGVYECPTVGVCYKTNPSQQINGNETGSRVFRETTNVIGSVFKLTDTLNIFGNIGQSFETPTFSEMSYNSNGTFNNTLTPATSNQYEIGVKALLFGNTLINASTYKINTANEISLKSQSGGQSVYQNINSSERKGFEFSLDSNLAKNLNLYASYSYLDAKFTSDFTSCIPFQGTQTLCLAGNPTSSSGGTETIASGAKIPGTYQHTAYTELNWKYSPLGFSTALEARAYSSTNVAFKSSYGVVPGYAVTAWRGGFTQKIDKWKVTEFVRIDNLLDKEYIGSIRVADLNSAYYEAAPTRNWLIGVNANYTF